MKQGIYNLTADDAKNLMFDIENVMQVLSIPPRKFTKDFVKVMREEVIPSVNIKHVGDSLWFGR